MLQESVDGALIFDNDVIIKSWKLKNTENSAWIGLNYSQN